MFFLPERITLHRKLYQNLGFLHVLIWKPENSRTSPSKQRGINANKKGSHKRKKRRLFFFLKTYWLSSSSEPSSLSRFIRTSRFLKSENFHPKQKPFCLTPKRKQSFFQIMVWKCKGHFRVSKDLPKPHLFCFSVIKLLEKEITKIHMKDFSLSSVSPSKQRKTLKSLT